MGITDWIILIILLITAVQGYRKGLAATLVRIGGIIGTLLLVGQIYPLVRNGLLLNFKLSGIFATILAVLLIAVLLIVLSSLIIFILNKLLKAANLSFVNKALGFLLGLGAGLLSVMALMAVLDYFPGLTRPLKDPAKHRVYVAADTLKEDLFTKLRLEERLKYQRILDKVKKDKEAEAAAE